MQSRSVKNRRIGDRLLRYTLKVVDDPSLPNSHEAATRLTLFLRDLLDQPALLMCGPVTLSTMRLHHNGEAWVLEAEADVYTETPDDPKQS